MKSIKVNINSFLIFILVSRVCFGQISLEIGSGSTLEIKNQMSINLSGNWTNLGSFDPGSSCVIFDGNNNQIVNNSGIETFFNVIINKPNGVLKLNNDINILNTLDLKKGNINSINSICSIGSGGSIQRTSGYIIGSLRRKIKAPELRNFEIGTYSGYSPVQVRVQSGEGELTVTAFDGSHPKVTGTSVLQRYWTINNDGIRKADLRFTYLAQDISGIEKDYSAGVFSGKWNFPKSELNSKLHTAAIAGVNPSGDWTLGLRESIFPSKIALNYSIKSGKVILSWQSMQNLNNSNFTLERADYWFKDWKVLANKDEIRNSSQGSTFIYTDAPPAGRYLYRLRQSDSDEEFQFSDEIEVALESPGTFALEQNYPNPFNSETKISYSIPIDAKVNITVFNVMGQIIAELVDEFKSAGSYSVNFDASNISSGTYLYKITAGNYVQTKKMVVLR
ncbi:MAG: T9SS type A sorting domain-containing protein [Bacillota bacterium]